MSSNLATLEIDGAVAVVSNSRPEKHNAADDAMDARLWEVLAQLHPRPEVRAVVSRGNGKPSPRDATRAGWGCARRT